MKTELCMYNLKHTFSQLSGKMLYICYDIQNLILCLDIAHALIKMLCIFTAVKKDY